LDRACGAIINFAAVGVVKHEPLGALVAAGLAARGKLFDALALLFHAGTTACGPLGGTATHEALTNVAGCLGAGTRS
jgi:hypothetical protein